ncbi:MAG: TIGR04255 family protein [Methylocella sp.]
MERPKDLPDFQSPPLSEVVVGIQFAPVQRYQQIRAGEVWALFRKEYPRVQELAPLQPMFETFGLPQGGQIGLGITMGATHNRFWFLSESGDELIQFQQDRLLHNWRKIANQTNEYPRFEKIISTFESEIGAINDYFVNLSGQAAAINQCELSYINHIPLEVEGRQTNEGDWLRFIQFHGSEPEDFSIVFRKTIRASDGRPQGRLTSEAVSGIDVKGQRIIVLTLTARGAPVAQTSDSALEFLKLGRKIIVKSFADITTDAAHVFWERVQ